MPIRTSIKEIADLRMSTPRCGSNVKAQGLYVEGPTWIVRMSGNRWWSPNWYNFNKLEYPVSYFWVDGKAKLIRGLARLGILTEESAAEFLRQAKLAGEKINREYDNKELRRMATKLGYRLRPRK